MIKGRSTEFTETGLRFGGLSFFAKTHRGSVVSSLGGGTGFRLGESVLLRDDSVYVRSTGEAVNGSTGLGSGTTERVSIVSQ
jgi:hypothetical protein